MRAAKPPSCPRCDYDQSGSIATWTETCPLTGRCPECGLEFDWLDVFEPDRQDVRWFYEHTPRGRLGVWRAIRTAARAIVPPLFWGQIGVRQRLAPRRMVLWVTGWLVAVQCVAGGLQVVIAERVMAANMLANQSIYYGSGGPTGPDELSSPDELPVCAEAFLRPWLDLQFGSGAISPRILVLDWPSYAMSLPVMTGFMGAMLIVLSASRRVAKVRPTHVLRATVFGLTGFVFVAQAIYIVPLAVEAARLLAASPQAVFNGDPAVQSSWTEPINFWYFNAFGLLWPWLLLLPWFALWWYGAIVRGLALPKGRLIWLLLSIAAVLLGLIVSLTDIRFRQSVF